MNNNEQKDVFVGLLLKSGLVKSEKVAQVILVVGSLILIGISMYLILG